jgi:hypothetical protein
MFGTKERHPDLFKMNIRLLFRVVQQFFQVCGSRIAVNVDDASFDGGVRDVVPSMTALVRAY